MVLDPDEIKRRGDIQLANWGLKGLGLVIVPEVPTLAMIIAGGLCCASSFASWTPDARRIWAAMVKAGQP